MDPSSPREVNEQIFARCDAPRAHLMAFEAGDALDLGLTGRPGENPVMSDPGWFGRGQQYLSFVKR